jgi:CheY-like chemotaxis protein
MQTEPLHILLADDDKDDRFLFREALSELPISTTLETVHDGEQLMVYLSEHQDKLPQVLFLDLNMPRKNGFECLSEIKTNDKLSALPVVMFSTSYPRDEHYESDMIKMLFNIGAREYIRKPGNFSELKSAIHKILQKLDEEVSANKVR